MVLGHLLSSVSVYVAYKHLQRSLDIRSLASHAAVSRGSKVSTRRSGAPVRGPRAREAIWPRARACTRMLPMAVASTGPATTVRPVASAANWFSSLFCEPPPTMWMVPSALAHHLFQRAPPPSGTPAPGSPARSARSRPRSRARAGRSRGRRPGCGRHVARRQKAAVARRSISGPKAGRRRPPSRSARRS